METTPLSDKEKEALPEVSDSPENGLQGSYCDAGIRSALDKFAFPRLFSGGHRAVDTPANRFVQTDIWTSTGRQAQAPKSTSLRI